MRRLLLILLAMIALPLVADAAGLLVDPSDWTGARTTPGGQYGVPDGVHGTNSWDDYGGFEINWTITQVGSNYEYSYEFEDDLSCDNDVWPGIDRWFLEVSENLNPTNVDLAIFDANFEFTPDSPKDWTVDTDCDTEVIHALKITTDSPHTSYPGNPPSEFAYEFTSTRAPVWGDFYAVSQEGYCGSISRAWNCGIGTDPVECNSPYTDWIPVPDTSDALIPEPASIGLWGLGLLAFAGFRRSRRRSNRQTLKA